MVEDTTFFISRQRRVAAWLVHLFTASGAVFDLFALWAIHEGRFTQALWLMGAALAIDSVDGVLARRAQTKVAAPKVDGALLDNMVDYITYVIVPAFFLLATDLLPPAWALVGTSVMVLASAYQFTQPEAKTDDHFFKGFPSYWNIVIFYLFLLQTSVWTNLFVIFFLSAMVLVPIKYVYPSRLDYLTPNKWLRRLFLAFTLLWGLASGGMLLTHQNPHPVFVTISLAYVVFYFIFSFYRTLVPMDETELDDEDV